MTKRKAWTASCRLSSHAPWLSCLTSPCPAMWHVIWNMLSQTHGSPGTHGTCHAQLPGDWIVCIRAFSCQEWGEQNAAVTRQLARMCLRCQGCGNLEGSKDTAWQGVPALCWTHQQRAALYLGSSSLCPSVSFLHMWKDKTETPADTSAAVSGHLLASPSPCSSWGQRAALETEQARQMGFCSPVQRIA